ncbi:MAG TPA: FmdB family zinc ribbon protein [Candidatus Dormibacteraeota bacterium]|nr:FmdB family zinc ribbon protein [Candidatus Dormibacteraeota bacterium]
MPHYGYRCQSCQREFETLQRMADPPQAACPDCGGAGTRLFYATGILFKGSGFYKTDSRATSAASSSAADSSKPAGDGAGASAKPAAAGKDAAPTPSAPKAAVAPSPASSPASD